uniref:PDZ domain-containing protein n=1 Tax=Echeneis naucrates TaxID=173247 RepID=A0A665X1K0_ECHNA
SVAVSNQQEEFPESGVIVKTAKDGCAEGLIYGGGGKEGIFIKEVVPESPASKSLKLKEGDQILSATVYFDNVSYEDAIQILEHAQAYKVKLCLKRKPDITETEPAIDSNVIPVIIFKLSSQTLTEVELDGQGSKFKMPKFGIKMPKIKGPEFDLSMSKKDVDVTLPEAKADVKLPDVPDVDVTLGSAEVSIPGKKIEVEKPELEIKSLKFKMPKFGIKMPKIKGPEFDLSMSKKDVDVTLPEAKADVKLPDVPDVDVTLGSAEVSIPGKKIEVEKPELEIKSLQTEVEPDGERIKFKMPKFGVKMPKIKGPEFDLSRIKLPDAPEVDVTLGSGEFEIPGKKVEVEKPELEIQPLQTEVELDGERSKFKMPKFGIKMPKIKGPEFDLSMSKKDADVTLPEAKAGIKLPDAPKVDIDLGKADVSIPEMKIEVEKPDMSKKDVDVTLPEAKADVKLPDVPDVDVTLGSAEVSIPGKKIEVEKPELEIKSLQTEVEPDGERIKFKMPKFGVKMPKIKGPEFDLSMSKKDADVTLPEAKAGIKLPDAPKVDIDLGKADVSIPEMKIEVEKPELDVKPLQTEAEVAGSKFKMPKFGVKMPKIKGPEFDLSMSKKDGDVTLPETKGRIKLPDAPEVDVTLGIELDGERSKFKMPKFGIKMPKIKGPEFDLSMSKKDGDVTLPEAKAGIKLPDAPKVDIDLGKADVSIPEMKIEVEKPELDVKPLQTEAEVAGSKFKMPKFGVKMPKIKGPEFDLSIVEVSIPGKKVEVEKPELEVQPLRTEVELDGERNVTLPETKGRIKLPDAPDVDVTLGTGEFEIPGKKIEIEKPDVEIKSLQTEVEPDGERSKFKMPKFGIKMPKIKGPEFDLSFSKKDVDVTLPEAKADVKLPDVPDVDVTLGSVEVSIPGKKIEVEKPELEVQPLQTEVELDGERSKFKMPKFGVKMPKIKGPEFDLSMSKKDGDVTLPETKGRIKLPDAPDVDVTLGSGEFDITGKKIEVEKPELDIKPLQTEVELDGQGSKFKMPKLGITMPKVKGPEFDLSLSKKEVDLALPEAKAEVNLPDVELKEPSVKVEIKGPEIKGTEKDGEGSPSKFKMPTFKLPKFGASTPNVNIEVSSKSKDIHLPETQLKSPEGVIVDIKTPDIDVESPSLEVKTTSTELDGKGSKFKMPKFGISMPKVKRPETDLSLPKKDIDVTLPQVKAPEVAIHQQSIEGSPSKFKMPTFKLPKFGVSTPKVSAEAPDIKIPDDGAAIDTEAPNTDFEGPSIDLKTTEMEHEGKGSKFKMPHFGFSIWCQTSRVGSWRSRCLNSKD